MRALLALLVLTTPAFAQDWATAEVCSVTEPKVVAEAFGAPGLEALEAEAADVPNGIGRFWRIETPDGKVSHLFGTYHSADPLILNVPAAVRDAAASAKTVATEIDFIPKTRDALRAARNLDGRYRAAGDPFAAQATSGLIAGLDETKTDWVRERAMELGWSDEVDFILSDAGIAEMLLSDPCEDFSQGLMPAQDDYIALLGRLAGAKVVGLEDPDAFIKALDADPDLARAVIAVYAAYLRPAETDAERSTAFALYLQGRLGLMKVSERAFLAEVLGPEAADAALAKTDAYMVDARNRSFAEALAPILGEGDALVAVGSAHLSGDAGLVALLASKGYKVTRVPLPGEAG